jgi:hypothetical protein
VEVGILDGAQCVQDRRFCDGHVLILSQNTRPALS